MGTKFKFANIFKTFDYFGVHPKFRINNDDNHKSISGGIASFLFFAFSFFYVLSSAIYFFKRENFSFIYTNKIITKDPIVNLKDHGFGFAIGLVNSIKYTDVFQDLKEFLEISFYHDNWYNYEFNHTYIPLNQCTINDFPELSQEDFESNFINKCLCPNLTNTEFKLRGLNGDAIFQSLIFSIKIKESMKDLTEIKKYFEHNLVSVVVPFMSTGIVYDDLENPLPHYLDFHYTNLDINFIKETEIGVSNLEFSSDENWLIPKPVIKRDSIIDNNRDYISSAGDRSLNYDFKSNLIKINIKASNRYYILERTYQKIPEFLANMSGLLSQILIILIITFDYTNEKGAQQKLINKTIKFNSNKHSRLDYLIELLADVEKRNDSINKLHFIKNNKKKVSPLNTCPNQASYIDLSNNKLIKSNYLVDNNNVINISSDLKNTKLSYQGIQVKNNLELELVIQNQQSHRKLFPRQSKILIDPSKIDKNKKMSNKRIFNRNFFQLIFFSIFSCTNKCKKQMKLLSNGEKKIHFYLDVLTYLRKMQEIDILKYLLLSKDQLRIFKFLSKPGASFDNTKNQLHNEYLDEEDACFSLNKEEVEKICFSYKNLLAKDEDFNEKDQKLLELFEEEVNKINQNKLNI